MEGYDIGKLAGHMDGVERELADIKEELKEIKSGLLDLRLFKSRILGMSALVAIVMSGVMEALLLWVK